MIIRIQVELGNSGIQELGDLGIGGHGAWGIEHRAWREERINAEWEFRDWGIGKFRD